MKKCCGWEIGIVLLVVVKVSWIDLEKLDIVVCSRYDDVLCESVSGVTGGISV